MLAEDDPLPVQLLSDEVVPVQVIGGVKGKEGSHAHHHGPQHLVAEIEVVVGKAAALLSQEAVVRVDSRVLGWGGAEGRPLFHTLQDEVNAVLLSFLHAPQVRAKVILLAHSLFRPGDGEAMVAGEGLDPMLVIVGSPREHLFGDLRYPDDLTEEVHDLTGPGEPGQITVNDDTVETVVDEHEQIAEQLGEQFHGLHYTRDGETRVGRRTIKRRPGKQRVEGKSFRLADEVRYLQLRAAEHDGRVVTLGQLVLFSTETGDAWLLDPSDQLAARLARDGIPEPTYIEEGDTNFAIGWKGRYRFEGPAFVYTDNESGRVSTVLGYPIEQIARQISNMFG